VRGGGGGERKKGRSGQSEVLCAALEVCAAGGEEKADFMTASRCAATVSRGGQHGTEEKGEGEKGGLDDVLTTSFLRRSLKQKKEGGGALLANIINPLCFKCDTGKGKKEKSIFLSVLHQLVFLFCSPGRGGGGENDCPMGKSARAPIVVPGEGPPPPRTTTTRGKKREGAIPSFYSR